MPTPYAEQPSMKTIKTYSTTVEADLARLALEAAGIPSTVVGISAGMEGGVAGGQMLVPDDRGGAGVNRLKDAGRLRPASRVAPCSSGRRPIGIGGSRR